MRRPSGARVLKPRPMRQREPSWARTKAFGVKAMQNRQFGRVLICAGAMAVSAAASSAVHAQGKWRAGAPIPQGANEVIGVAIDGQLLVYGGQDPTSSPQGI